MTRRALAIAAAAAGLVLGLPGDATAQCAMCIQSAQAAGSPDAVARTFNLAILVLIVPVSAGLAGAGLLLWRFREGVGPTVPGPAAHPPRAVPAARHATRMPSRRSRGV